jgi:DNA-binding transcriptional MocR family regulator
LEFTTARRYAFDAAPRPFVRLGYACLDETELVESVRRMRVAWG